MCVRGLEVLGEPSISKQTISLSGSLYLVPHTYFNFLYLIFPCPSVEDNTRARVPPFFYYRIK